MGNKSKIEELGLKELVIEKSEGRKRTIIYVTDEVNKYLEENGLKVTVSREAIRRVLNNHDEEAAIVRQSIEGAKAMAEILRDHPGTEMSEGTLMKIAHLISMDIRSISGIEFDNPVDMVNSFVKIANTQLKMSAYRRKAVDALEAAKREIKKELTSAIHANPELLNQVMKIVDAAEIK